MIRFLFFCSLVCFFSCSPIALSNDRDETTASERQTKPNIVIIMADDLGYGDIGCYGNQRIKTPNLDEMAKHGLRFTDFHSSGTVCSPTRCGLLTGRYQQRAGIPAVVSVKHKHLGMDQSEFTFAEALKTNGYSTAVFGKWHVGYETKYNPIHQGFDEFRGYVSGNVDFFSHIDQSGAYDWWNGDKQVVEEGYTTELITKHAVRFINENKAKPFCLYLPHESPHYPYQGPNDKAERTVGGKFKTQGSRTDIAVAYKEMVESLDESIGKVIATLKQHNLEKNTLVWFFSDNGANPKGDNGGLRGFKGSVWEGGHRVPSIAYWPGKIKENQTNDSLSITLDVFPTIAAITKSKTPEGLTLDGMDISSVLFQNQALENRQLFWGAGNQRAMRNGSWKLVMEAKGIQKSKAKAGVLIDLSIDRSEKTDLSKTHQLRFKKMKQAIADWNADVGPSSFKKER